MVAYYCVIRKKKKKESIKKFNIKFSLIKRLFKTVYCFDKELEISFIFNSFLLQKNRTHTYQIIVRVLSYL